MPHQRQLIRDAIAARLVGKTAAEDRVYVENRVRVTQGKLPAIVVFFGDEDSAPNDTAPRELTRSIEVVIMACVAGSIDGPVANARDDLALEIETLMHADPYLVVDGGALAADSFLSGTELLFDPAGDRPMAAASLTYVVEYQTLAPEAPELPDDFELVDVRHRIPEVTDPLLDGHDTFDVENP